MTDGDVEMPYEVLLIANLENNKNHGRELTIASQTDPPVKCIICKLERPVSIFDGSEGEYHPICVCRQCLLMLVEILPL